MQVQVLYCGYTMPARMLVTGGLGFMGSDFIRYVLGSYLDVEVVNVDKITYAANPANVASVVKDKRYHFTKADIADYQAVDRLWRAFKPDYLVNFAAETHVDRSILDPQAFIRTDVLGTQTLLEIARRRGIKRFLQISTDEVYGSITKGSFTEQSPLSPSSPYSASKAGGDMLVQAYHATYGLPVLITRSCNNFGPFQYPEKIIPLFITNLLEGKKVPLYGDGSNVRTWIYVRDHSRAIVHVLRNGSVGEIYNIGTSVEVANRDLTKKILGFAGASKAMVEHVADRPGHDFRYSLSWNKLKALGFKPSHSFDEGLRETVRWYKINRQWWQPIKSGEYLRYYERQYGGRAVIFS